MYITPVGFILFPLAIWLLWQASKTARFNLNQIILDKESRRLKRKSDLNISDDDLELENFFSNSRKKVYKAGLFILASFIVMFCAFFFTVKTPISNEYSPAWLVALFVWIFFTYAVVFQFIIPLLDLKQLQSDRKELLNLDD